MHPFKSKKRNRRRNSAKHFWGAFKMNKSFIDKLLIPAACLSVFLPNLFAHQPRLVGDQTDIIVTLPEISKAYYGNLNGKPVTYHIQAQAAFRLYVNILVPDIEGIEKDVSVKISKKDTVISLLDAAAHNWTGFYEPFAGDAYFKGPEYLQTQEPGAYEIQVYSPDNHGKYVLAVGDREAFPFDEIIKTYIVLPRLKSEFFGKSPFSAYSNIMGIFLAVIILVILITAAILFFAIKFIKKRLRRKK